MKKMFSLKFISITSSLFVKTASFIVLFCLVFQLSFVVSGKNRSKINGVQIGTITYSYRSMPDQSIPAILGYVVQSGLGSVELMGPPVEQYAGIPDTGDKEVLRQWRLNASMDKFKEIRKMFKAEGVKIDILKLGKENWSNEEIDYAFEVCKVLGARGISMEISEIAATRFAPLAKKHKRLLIFHNHGQPADPNFSFEKILEIGDNLMLNFDAGHYFGFTGEDPTELIKKLHHRIASIHIKDKTGPKALEPNVNKQFGKGETPVVEILQLIRNNNWPITFDIELEYAIPEDSDAIAEVKSCLEFCRLVLLLQN